MSLIESDVYIISIMKVIKVRSKVHIIHAINLFNKEILQILNRGGGQGVEKVDLKL